MSSQQQQIDRLATTCRLLYDVRVIAQRQEIERQKQQIEQLKIDIFWRDHSLHRFNEAMKMANLLHVQCTCQVCTRKKNDCAIFHHDDFDIDENACTFLPWLYRKMDEHDFLVVVGFGVMHYFGAPGVGRLDKRNHCVPDLCHFANTTLPDLRGYRHTPGSKGPECATRPQRDFGLFRFGVFLTGAETVDDPNLKKYAAFLRMLEGSTNYDDDDDEEENEEEDA
jgi:hypothetical protein